ncbi:hypothetical protein ZIOFF_070668 [Zingiber officinale]|uniref:Small ribosomal subunit protein uS17 N-terminal domain-containing protein n=1 Tax=Zingiber officinale TaxID=94328 RepID=A0A8J5C8M7_ZINOF|nr:hypothetical protein ZIOFF_070668 [Zingiber officinale]
MNPKAEEQSAYRSRSRSEGERIEEASATKLRFLQNRETAQGICGVEEMVLHFYPYDVASIAGGHLVLRRTVCSFFFDRPWRNRSVLVGALWPVVYCGFHFSSKMMLGILTSLLPACLRFKWKSGYGVLLSELSLITYLMRFTIDYILLHRCSFTFSMVDQSRYTERAFLKQPKVFLSSKTSGKGKKPGKGGNRFWKNVGLGFKTPREAIEGHLPYEKRHSNIPAHISPCFRVKEGDHVIIGQCRPLSKTVRFNVLKVIPAGSTSSRGKKGFTAV